VEFKNELTGLLRQKSFDALIHLSSIRVINGQASFLNQHEVKVRPLNAPDIIIQAKRIVISTGTVPFIPVIPGLEQSARIYTSTSLLNEKVLPEKLVIIGGGFISLEFASMYTQYGAKVTILDLSPVFLPQEDADMAREVKKVLIQKGVEIINGAVVKEIKSGLETDQIFFEVEGQAFSLEANAILIATGRKAYTDDLNLSAARVFIDKKGFVAVNEFLQTNISHIWAMGDINGGPQFTYISLDDFRIMKDQLQGTPERKVTDRENVAFCVFVTPPFAHVGLREKEAIAKGLPIKIVKIPAGRMPRAQILQQTDGVLKAIIHEKTDQILGFTLFCAESQEMINTVRLAMNAGYTYSRLKDEIFTHPSMTEAFNYFD
jgi:pyruvate/2-oxoglutarate dehydrogenase complex dihydrolipoamide dehydrogenase (E3) component